MNDSKSAQAGSGFTGRTRKRKTSAKVKFTDTAAKTLITLGGIGTIGAVVLVCLFLVSVVIPLFLPASAKESVTIDLDQSTLPIHFTVDEYRTIGAAIYADGRIDVHRLEDGKLVESVDASSGQKLSALGLPISLGLIAMGFEDGSVHLGTLGFKTDFFNADDLDPQTRQQIDEGHPAIVKNGVLSRTPQGQYRSQSLLLEITDELDPLADSPVKLLDISSGATGPVFTALMSDGSMHVGSVRRKRNLMTGKTTSKFRGGQIPYKPMADGAEPIRLRLFGLGDTLMLVWEDGRAQRFDCRDYKSISLAEELKLVSEPGETVTDAVFMNGRSTLMIGTSTGRVRALFGYNFDETTADAAVLAEKADRKTIDSKYFVIAHELPAGSAAVSCMAPSTRSRMLAVGFTDGTSRLYHVTTNQQLLDLKEEKMQSPVAAISIAPKDNGLAALSSDGLMQWGFDAGHPTITAGSIFTPVWYEGRRGPTQEWQSSAGTDDYEPKYGLYPLVFGTIKATIYSMMFGLPIAILAAVYTSEFLHPRVKAWIKPTVELMASLPSVVLGYLAAIIFAPFVEAIVPGILASFLVIPLVFMGGAQLWQLLPHPLTIRMDNLSMAGAEENALSPRAMAKNAIFRVGGVRMILLVALFFLAIWMSMQLGPLVERMLFEGDIMLWLNGQKGEGWPGWLLPMLPLSGIIVAILCARFINPNIARLGDNMSRFSFAILDMAKWLGCVVLTLGLAVMASVFLSNGLGWDPRGSFVGTYDQRNAMIVGFVMGFAIIPIIYTIAEDALSAVPEHLRSASLGAGATPWQTATRVIMPTAMSGLFSATMIGLGRAVGETMIVLMAAGNTPVYTMNIFNGFRTLSANIAVELPEAPIGGTHYRMLFLAALTLFAMTFVVNTVAESVRQRFRKRAFAL